MGNFSRDTFDRLKHYVSVRLQQGVPIVDADWNELQDIRKDELETFLKWFIGDGVPAGNDGFAIGTVAADNDFSIADGCCLVAGWEVVNDWMQEHPEGPLQYTSQRLFDNDVLAAKWGVSSLPLLTTPPAPGLPRIDTVYLDVWEREVDASDDNDIVNPDIGIETSVRTRREWVVRVAEAATEPPSPPPEGHVFYPLATLYREAGQSEITDVTDRRRTGLSLALLKERADGLEASKVDRAGDHITGDLVVEGHVDVDGPATAITADTDPDAEGNKRGVLATASGEAGHKYGLYGVAAGNDSGTKCGVHGVSTGDAGLKFGVRGYASGDGKSKTGVYGQASGTGTKFGVKAYVKVNDSAAKYGVYTQALGAGGTKYGVFSRASGDGGKKYGLHAETSGTGGVKYGVSGSAEGDDTADKYGVYSAASGDGGTKYGLYAETSGTGGSKYGVWCSAEGDDTTTKCGICAEAKGASGTKHGIEVSASGASGTKTGIVTLVSGSSGTKCGIAASASGSSGTKTGILAAASGSSGTKYGIYASASGAGTNYAGYFLGNLEVTGDLYVGGTINKPTSTFCIDHVLDPDNKVLRHSMVESPEDLCVYRGKVTLDRSGKATVDMPHYFAALTKEEEATALLTPIGEQPCLLSYTWQKRNTRLVIQGEPGVEVSYLVLADRDDPVIRQLRRPVEEDKETAGFEKGKLLHPEAYGQPPYEEAEPEALRGLEPEPEEVEPPREEADEEASRRAEERQADEELKELQALEAETEELRRMREAEEAVEQQMIERARAKARKRKSRES